MHVSSSELQVLVPQSIPLLRAAAESDLPIGHPVFITGDDGCFQLDIALRVADVMSGDNVHVFGIADLSMRIDVLASCLGMASATGKVGTVVMHSGAGNVYDKLLPYLRNKVVLFVGPEGTAPADSALKFSFQWLCKDYFYTKTMKHIYADDMRKLPLKDKTMTDMLWAYSGGCPELLMASIISLRSCREKSEVCTFMEQQTNVVKVASELTTALYCGDVPKAAERVEIALSSCQWRPLLPHVMSAVQSSVLTYPEASIAAGLNDVLALSVTTEAQFVNLCMRVAVLSNNAQQQRRE